MAVTRQHSSATPEQVWAVLANPDGYAGWVVGSQDVRAADPGFPAPGTRFHHRVGVGPLTIADHSQVIESRPPTYLHLEVKARPLGRARVLMTLVAAADGGTDITIDETPISPGTRLLYNPLAALLLKGRNEEALRRLGAMAEGREPIPETTRSRSAPGGSLA